MLDALNRCTRYVVNKSRTDRRRMPVVGAGLALTRTLRTCVHMYTSNGERSAQALNTHNQTHQLAVGCCPGFRSLKKRFLGSYVALNPLTHVGPPLLIAELN